MVMDHSRMRVQSRRSAMQWLETAVAAVEATGAYPGIAIS